MNDDVKFSIQPKAKCEVQLVSFYD